MMASISCGLEVVLEGRHARRAVLDELAHDVVVAAAGVLVERRAIGLRPERGRQMAHPARLCENLAAELLLIGEIVGGLLGEGPLPRGQQQQPEPRDALHLSSPLSAFFDLTRPFPRSLRLRMLQGKGFGHQVWGGFGALGPARCGPGAGPLACPRQPWRACRPTRSTIELMGPGEPGAAARTCEMTPPQATAARSGKSGFERRSSRRVRQKAAPPLRKNDCSGLVTTR